MLSVTMKKWWNAVVDSERKPLLSPYLFLLLTAALIAFGLTTYLSLVVFQDQPLSQDEYSYLFQAKLFLQGKTYLAVNQKLLPLRETHILMQDGKYFSKYPPGFSGLLSLGLLLHVPGLINPFLSGAFIIVLGLLLRRLITQNLALITVFVVTANSYFLGYGGSYFAQSLMLLLTICSFYCYHRYCLTFNPRHLYIAGLCIAFGFLTRQLDATCILLVLLCGMLPYWKRRVCLLHSAVMLVIGLCGLLVLMLYNYRLVDCFCISSYKIWKYDFVVLAPHAHNGYEQLSTLSLRYWHLLLKYMPDNFTDKFLYMIGLLFLVIACIGIIFHRTRITGLCVLFIALNVLLYNFHPGTGWPQYGARYWYPALGPLSILFAYGLQTIYRNVNVCVFMTLCGLLFLSQGMRFDEDIHTYERRVSLLHAMQKDITSACPGDKTLVVLEWLKLTKDENVHFINFDLLRQQNFPLGSRLIVFHYPQATAILPWLPGYHVCPTSNQNLVSGSTSAPR